MKMQ
jgi:hypothetical protein